MKVTLERIPRSASQTMAGATVTRDGVFFRVWAPDRERVEAIVGSENRAFPLARVEEGYFEGLSQGAGAGVRYRFRLDGDGPFPDPCSRFQPEGPHGPSEAVDPSSFRWSDSQWGGIRLEGQVIYELHVGAYTREGTFDALVRELGHLARLGVTAIELMPIAEFPGRFNWGYDGVGLYAPSHRYGGPEALKRLVDAAHRRGLAVILDVVYNHLGPDGNYLPRYSKNYFTDRYKNDWGPSLNFDGPGSGPVRRFFTENAAYWIREYRLDGLRLDATQDVCDSGPAHVISEAAAAARRAAGSRRILIIAENEPQDFRGCLSPEEGGRGVDALWIDDFHHASRVALTGRREAYYTDYTGTPQEFVSLYKRGSLFQGQYYHWQEQCRGVKPPGVAAAASVWYLENHDQVANSVDGRRLERASSPAAFRALAATLLFSPATPLLFMGQEFGSTSPFLFFADHGKDLAKLVAAGRREFLSQFPGCAAPGSAERFAEPGSEATFEASRPDFSERFRNEATLRFYEDLLAMRREDPFVSRQDAASLDGAVLAAEAFLIRWFGEDGDGRLFVVNLGRETRLKPAPEPLLAPPYGREWRFRWSSEDARYGGSGAVNPLGTRGWNLPAKSASFFDTVAGEAREARCPTA